MNSINETLYEFIQRTLVRPEYELKKAAAKFETQLLMDYKTNIFEPSFVINTTLPKINKIIQMLENKYTNECTHASRWQIGNDG